MLITDLKKELPIDSPLAAAFYPHFVYPQFLHFKHPSS